MSFSAIQYDQYLLQRSSDVKYFALPSQSVKSLCHGRGYKSFIIILLRAQQSMQKCSDPSGFLENSIGAPHGKENGCIAPASNNSTNYFLNSNNSWGLCLYMDFYTGLAPSSIDISCMSPRFQLGCACVGSVPGNTLQYLHNTIHNDVLYFFVYIN